MSKSQWPLFQWVYSYRYAFGYGLAVLLLAAGTLFLVYKSRLGCGGGALSRFCGEESCRVEGCGNCDRCGLILPNYENRELVFIELNTSPGDSPQLLKVSGRTNAPAEVTLNLNGLPYRKTRTKHEDRFDFGEVVVNPGQVRVVVEASRVSGGRLYLASRSKVVPLTWGQISGTAKSSEGGGGIKVNLIGPGSDAVTTVKVADKGQFASPLLRPGEYEVEVESEGGKKDRRKIELNEEHGYRFDGDFVLETSGAAPRLKVDRRTQKRSVEADISYRSLTLRLHGTLPAGDKRFVLLNCPREERAQCLPQFVKSVYGEFSVAGTPLYASFADPGESSAGGPDPVNTPTPEPKDKDKDAAPTNFNLKSKATSAPFTASLDQDWVVTTDWEAGVRGEDSFHAKFRQYELDKIAPPTGHRPNPREATWEGSRDVPEISFAFNYKFGPLSLVRLLFTSPFDLVPAGEWQTLLYYIRGVLLAIPLVWLLHFLNDRQGFKRQEGGLAGQLRHSLPALVAVPFVEPVISTVRQLALPPPAAEAGGSRVHEALAYLLGMDTSAAAKLSQEDVRVLVVSAVIVAAVACLLFLVSRLLVRWGSGFWLMHFVRGTFCAALIVLAMLTATGVAVTFLPSDLIHLPRLLTAALVWAFLAWLVRVFYFYSAYLKKSRFALVAVPLLLLGLFVAAYPGGLSDFTDWLFRGNAETAGSNSVIVATHSEVLEGLRNFFRTAQLLVPYVALPGVALLLKGRDFRAGGARGGALVVEAPAGEALAGPAESPLSDDEFRGAALKLSLIIFAGVLVGTQWTWFLLPLPFALAFLTYNYLWLPEMRIKVIDDVVPTVCAQRPRGENEVPRGWGNEVASMLEMKALKERLTALDKNGQLKTEEREAEQKILESRIEAQSVRRKLSEDEDKGKVIRVSEVLLGVGPEPTNWKNAEHAVRYGIRLAWPLALLSCLNFWLGSEPEPGGYRLFAVGGQFLLSFAHWLTAAFFFGYFFNYLCGETGVVKALHLAGYAAIPIAASTRGLSVIWPYAAAFFCFAVALAVWAFDHHTFRSMFGRGQSEWRQFLKLENAPSPGSVTSLVKTGLMTFISGLVLQAVTLVVLVATYGFLPEWLRKFIVNT